MKIEKKVPCAQKIICKYTVIEQFISLLAFNWTVNFDWMASFFSHTKLNLFVYYYCYNIGKSSPRFTTARLCLHLILTFYLQLSVIILVSIWITKSFWDLKTVLIINLTFTDFLISFWTKQNSVNSCLHCL